MALLKYLATDPKAESVLSNELKNVPTTTASLKATEPATDAGVQAVPRDLRPPEDRDEPDQRGRGGEQELFEQMLAKYQAARCPTCTPPSRGRRADRRQVENASGPQVP